VLDQKDRHHRPTAY